MMDIVYINFILHTYLILLCIYLHKKINYNINALHNLDKILQKDLISG